MSAPSFPWTTLGFAALIAACVYAWARIKRARTKQRTRSQERAAELMRALESQRHALGTPPTSAPSSTSKLTPRPRAALAPSAASVKLARKPRLLTEPQQALFQVLRAGLADHLVMANIRLADLVDPASGPTAPARELRMRGLLLERVDCVVCDQDLVPLAAVVVYDTPTDKVPDEQVKAEALRELGIRFLRFRAEHLPRPAEMRALILG